MDAPSGCLKLARKLDREMVETIILNTLVVDINAESEVKPQTATGRAQVFFVLVRETKELTKTVISKFEYKF